jgi:hypothetical protein
MNMNDLSPTKTPQQPITEGGITTRTTNIHPDGKKPLIHTQHKDAMHNYTDEPNSTTIMKGTTHN